MRFLATLLLFIFGWVTAAHADLQVYPTRLTMSDSLRAGMLSVKNRGDKPDTFRVSLSYFRMKPDGNLELATDSSKIERPILGDYIRYTPREFVLAPGAEQIVRVMWAGPGDLADGEYRCHLNIEPAPAEAKPQAGSSKGPMRVILEAKLAVAVPIFFKRGKVESTVEVDKLRLLSTPDGGTAAVVDLKFEGNSYPFGEFHALWEKGKDDPIEVGLVRGVAAYISPRAVTIPLTVAKEKLSGTKLRVEFRLPDGETAQKFVEAKIP